VIGWALGRTLEAELAVAALRMALKYEEVYRNEYRDFHDARVSISEFLELVY